MSGPFKVGDVVVCVEEDCCPVCALYPDEEPWMVGKFFSVELVLPPPDDCNCQNVRLAGAGDFLTGQIRHLPKADEQFTAQMRAIKPVRKTVSA